MALATALIFNTGLAVAKDGPVTLESLLREMIDPAAVARWPQPEYLCKQDGSYDREAKTPNDASKWYANGDNMEGMHQAAKWEDHQGRPECVLLDVDGPGAVVRIWTGGADPKGKVRFYLDGADAPVIEAPLYDLLGGRDFVPKPLAIENSGKATNLYLPIPYAKHCKITYDEGRPPGPPPGRWYNIEYRAYPPGTRVEPFTMAGFKALQPLVAEVVTSLTNPPADSGGRPVTLDQTLAPGKEATLELPAGNNAVRELTVTLDGMPVGELEAVLRATVLRANFDGEETIWCPLGEFFGSGVGLNELQSWTRTVNPNGTMTCRWVMPYQKSARLGLLNLGKGDVRCKLQAKVGAWKWDERSLIFHSNWHYQNSISTRPYSDWNFLQASGRGIYVGDTLALWNPNGKWWGEGDEKIWVDGEGFPSHFGTGSEDYYGYAWGNPALFQGPFCNQPRAGHSNKGHTTNTRTRSLDAIPFTRSLKHDMEIWHWAGCQVTYSVATYWYAAPGTTHNRKPQPEGASAAIDGAPTRLPGAIECERMKVLTKSPDLASMLQTGVSLGGRSWSGDAQLLVQAKKPGDFVELVVAENVQGPQKLTLYATKSYDFGTLRFSVNGSKIEPDWDAYAPQPALTGPMGLGTFEPKDGKIVMRVEVTGANPAAKDTRSFFGLDCVVMDKP
jgi:hypothetical protein